MRKTHHEREITPDRVRARRASCARSTCPRRRSCTAGSTRWWPHPCPADAPPHRRRLRFGVTGALAAAVIAVVLVLASSGGSSQLTLHTAVALTQRPATMPAPAESADGGEALAAHVEGVAFPYWEDRGWRATGERVDRAGGRDVTTVFYRGRPRAVGRLRDRRGQRRRRASAAGSSSRAAACPTASPSPTAPR